MDAHPARQGRYAARVKPKLWWCVILWRNGRGEWVVSYSHHGNPMRIDDMKAVERNLFNTGFESTEALSAAMRETNLERGLLSSYLDHRDVWRLLFLHQADPPALAFDIAVTEDPDYWELGDEHQH
jgi:hypothetical protein